MAISRENVAAQIMEHLCTCPERGCSQPRRHGTSGCCSVATDAGMIKVKRGARDCSSAVCEAWELALAGTAFDGLITRYNWMGVIDGAPGDQTGREPDSRLLCWALERHPALQRRGKEAALGLELRIRAETRERAAGVVLIS